MTTTEVVRERPIAMSTAEVRGILDGRRTQVRRPVKLPDDDFDDVVALTDLTDGSPFWRFSASADGATKCGDMTCLYGEAGKTRLWVRETWCLKEGARGGRPEDCWFAADGVWVRRTDGDGFGVLNKDGSEASPWSPSIHMPRWASRITLELTAVRVERLQAITREDAVAEGIPEYGHEFRDGMSEWDLDLWRNRTTVENFAAVWDSISGKRPGYSWESNPWTWVLSFRPLTPTPA